MTDPGAPPKEGKPRVTLPDPTGKRFSLRYLEEIQEGSQLEWIRTLIAIALAGYLFSFATEFVGESDISALVTESATILLLTLALWISSRFSSSLGAFLTVSVIWLELHLSLLWAGDVKNTVLPVMPVLVAGSGLLLGGRAAKVVGFLTALSAPAAVILGRFIKQDLPIIWGQDLKIFGTQAAILIAMAFVVSLFLDHFGRAWESARRNQRRFSDLVAGNPNGILALSGDGRVEEINPAAEGILGISAENVVGKRLRELPLGLGGGFSAPPSLGGPGLCSLPVEEEWTRADGNRMWVETVRQPLVGPDGSSGLMLVVRDLTRKRNAEDRATQLGRIVEEARNEILVFDRDSLEILMANRGARNNLGYTKDEIRGMAMFQVQPTLTPEGGRALAKALYEDDEGVVTVNAIHHRKDGSVYPLEIQFQKGLLDGRSTIVAFGVDITDREKAEEEQRLLQAQLQHAQKMEAVGLLAGGVAHDFNNLLTVIGGCGEILLEIGDDEVRNLTGEIMESQERGAALTQQLLAFARRELVQPEDLPLSRVLEDMEALIRRVLSERIRLETEYQEGVVIRADRSQIEQVVLNLAANARDAMEEGGTLTIRVASSLEEATDAGEGEFISLIIQDTGEGMDSQTMERVFEPFFTTKPRGKGTGLGLSTVHGIVSQNGGRMSVESELGKGTSFRILWPSASGESEPETPEEIGETPPPTRGKILVAEDEDAARTLIQTVLEREGYVIVGVENGNEALAILVEAEEAFDLLVTDIVMPGISGLELAERVKKVRPNLPILFMSGYVDVHLQGPEGSPGSLNLLAKPFRPNELRRRVRELLEGT